jgi:molybdate transport system regulatory protein
MRGDRPFERAQNPQTPASGLKTGSLIRKRGKPSMARKECQFRIRSKIWVENADGKVVFGLGRYRILEAVQRLGSLQAAAQELKMSYRAIWARISATEQRLGKPLLIRQPWGSRLTPLGETLLHQFQGLQRIVEKESNTLYENLMAAELGD